MAKKATQAPLGVRLNNPLNVVYVAANKFQGLASPAFVGRFCQFTTPIWGIRAAVVILIAYADRHGCKTLWDFIERWAPHNENDVAAYVNDVSRRSGVGSRVPFNPHDYDQCRRVVEAMIWHENGVQPYTAAQLDKALTLAGVEPPRDGALIATSRTVKGSAIGVGTGALAVAAAAADQLAPVLPVLGQVAEFIRTYPGLVLGLVGIAVIVGAGWAIYAKWDDRRRGIA